MAEAHHKQLEYPRGRRTRPSSGVPAKSAAPAQNGTSDTVTSPARRDRGTLASAPELNARLERVLAHLLKKATAALHNSGTPTTSASTSMAHTKKEVLKYDQSTCPLFRLPPELRNNIYTYVAYSKFSLPQFEWDEEQNSPKLNLKCAQPRAPANELLRTCRSIYDESEGIFVRAKTQFWSDTTFTLALPTWPPHHSFGYLECLTDEQVSHMTRVNIKIEGSQPFTVHLRSGPEADSSVTYPSRVAGCNHRSLLTAPLSFVKRVIASDQLEGQLSYHDVLTILWQMSRGLARPSVPFCVEHQKKPVVLSLQNMSRAGLMAVVAWTCGGSRCGRI